MAAPATAYQPRPVARPMFAAPQVEVPRAAASPRVETRTTVPVFYQTQIPRTANVSPAESRRPVITSGQWEPVKDVH